MAQFAQEQTEMSKRLLMEMYSEEVFGWEVQKLVAALKNWAIQIGISWLKSRKVNELYKALEMMKNQEKDKKLSSDRNFYMIEAFQQIQQQNDMRKMTEKEKRQSTS